MRIGIVDDMPEESANMKHALNCLGAELAVEFEIHCFSSGEDFLKHFEPGGFDVVFMDIYMQGMSGQSLYSDFSDHQHGAYAGGICLSRL